MEKLLLAQHSVSDTETLSWREYVSPISCLFPITSRLVYHYIATNVILGYILWQ